VSAGDARVDKWYPERRFGGFTHVDGTVVFYTRVNSLLDRSTVVLDMGCGRGVAAEDPVPPQVKKERSARLRAASHSACLAH